MYEIDRTRKVAELVKREVATLVSRELNDNRINAITITGVTLSRDLKYATIYFSMFASNESSKKTESLLKNSSNYLRRLLSQNLNLRITPALLFKYDETVKRGAEMSKLLNDLNINRQAEKTKNGQEA